MKVSVLVPVYGVEKYIGRCAESLFAQTYKDIEYVFVDDCTPDRSMDVLRSVVSRHPVRQAQVKVIRNAVNSGIGAVRQTLIDNATGDCLTFVDSDDYLPPRAVELMCAEMGRGGVDIVDGAWQRVTSGGLSGVNTPCHECDDRRYLKLLLCQNIVSNRLWGRLYRRSLFTRNGVRLVPGIDYSEDYSVITRLMFHARRSFIDDVVYYYSDENTSSYTHTMSPKHVRSYIRANRVVLDFFSADDRLRRYSEPLQIGLLNVLRNVRANKFSFAEADSLLGYVPRGLLFRLVAAMLRGKCPFRLAEAAYLALRRAYVSTVAGGRSERG